jgi:choline dehydrogenase-like flavoprotein
MTALNLDQLDREDLTFGVCIVGTGAAGIALACELDGCGVSVLLLEGGSLKLDPTLDDHYAGIATPPHPDPTQFRRMVFGGTTKLWGGRCLPYDPIDLLPRDHVENSGWPISHAELIRHYPKAMEYCDAGHFDFSTTGSLPDPAPSIAGFSDDAIITDRIERYSLPTDFGRRYAGRLKASGNVTTLLGARCVGLVRAPGEDRIGSVLVADRAGKRRTVHARVFILATGGIEVPRLLMASDLQGGGFGNQGDQLGRNYMCHFENTCGRIVPGGAKVVFGFERTTDGVYARRQIRFSEKAQAEHRLLNMAFRLHFPNYSDATHGSAAMSAIYLAKSVLVPEYQAILGHNAQDTASPTTAHLRNVILGLPQLASFTADWLFRIKLAERKLPYTLIANADGSFPLEFNSEQTPLAGNRITLLNETDRDGLPRVHVNWQLGDADADAAFRGFVLLRDSLARSGSCRLDFDEPTLRERIGRSVPLGGHHIGTARMAASPRNGVVDENCAVFGLPNLFVASSAVFPTSSHANPTLTIVAMAVRLAAHLRTTLASI